VLRVAASGRRRGPATPVTLVQAAVHVARCYASSSAAVWRDVLRAWEPQPGRSVQQVGVGCGCACRGPAAGAHLEAAEDFDRQVLEEGCVVWRVHHPPESLELS
jgi:hypothetical protein